jgi:4-coumarate--CoA ligase
MPVKSRFALHIPNVSLPTYLFTSPTGPLSNVPILIDAKRPATHYLSFSTYRSWSKRLAVGLLAAGLQPGDRVLMFSPNSIFYPVVFMGVVMAGGIFTGMNPGAGIREVVSQLGDSGARWVLAGRERLGVALEAVEKVGGEAGRERVFVFDDEVRGEEEGDIKHWSSLLAPEKEGNAFMWEELSTREQADGPAVLNYSSGTTGMPKGVVISHRNFVANTAQWIHMANMDPEIEEKRKKSSWLGFLPMYHAMAQLLFVLAAPKRDIPVYIPLPLPP